MVGMFPSAASLMGCTSAKFSSLQKPICSISPKTQKASTRIQLQLSAKERKGSSDTYLVVSSRIGQNQKARLAEGVLELIRERSGGMATSDGLRAGVLRELQHSPLPVRPRRLDDDVLRVLDGDDDSRRELQLLPRLPEIDNENPV